MSWETENPKRLVEEVRAMRERYGQAPKLKRAPDGKLCWEHRIAAEGNDLPIQIVYPANYPNCAPELFIQCKMPPGTPHLLDKNRVCWRRDADSRGNNIWAPATDTGALVVGVAYRWFLTFLVWHATRKWVIPDALSGR